MAATVSAPSGASWLPHDDAFNLDGWTRATEPAASPKHAHANAHLHKRAQHHSRWGERYEAGRYSRRGPGLGSPSSIVSPVNSPHATWTSPGVRPTPPDACAPSTAETLMSFLPPDAYP